MNVLSLFDVKKLGKTITAYCFSIFEYYSNTIVFMFNFIKHSVTPITFLKRGIK